MGSVLSVDFSGKFLLGMGVNLPGEGVFLEENLSRIIVFWRGRLRGEVISVSGENFQERDPFGVRGSFLHVFLPTYALVPAV